MRTCMLHQFVQAPALLPIHQEACCKIAKVLLLQKLNCLPTTLSAKLKANLKRCVGACSHHAQVSALHRCCGPVAAVCCSLRCCHRPHQPVPGLPGSGCGAPVLRSCCRGMAGIPGELVRKVGQA